MTTPGHSTRLSARAFAYLYSAALLGLLLLGLVFEAMGEAARIDEPTDLDNAVHRWVVSRRPDWPWLTTLFRWATCFGNPDVATLATVLIAFVLFASHRRGMWRVRAAEPFVWLGAIAGGRLLSLLFKELFRRDRPPIVHRLVAETTYSFPSGHSVFAAVFFTMLAYVLVRTIRPDRWALRLAAAASCVLLAILVAASRVWLGVHYPTDVVGGLLLGVGWTLTVWLGRVGWDHWRDSRIGAA